MFKPADKTELNQISLTGMRALILLGLLMEAPRSLDEIREKFIEYNVMENHHSNDIIRIDLNTLRAMGCDISRSAKKTGFKHVLLEHPFSLHITEEEILLLKRVYKKVKDISNIATLILYDELFKKLANHVTDVEIKEELCGLSVLKYFDIDLIKQLQNDCKHNKILKLMYQNPTSKEESIKEIAVQKLVFQNDKIYLYGFDLGKKESIVLNFKRIKAIFSRRKGSDDIEAKTTVIKFLLKEFDDTDLEENESVLETHKDGCVIQGQYHNEFIAMQRVLSFGANCIVIEPEDFREKVIKKLKSMRNNYNG